MSGNNINKKNYSPNIFFPRNPELSACPSCGQKGVLRRSHPRNFREKLLHAIMPVGYYRCRKCGWRGKLFKYKLTKNSYRNLLFYLALALVSAGIIKFVIAKLVLK